jgi:hypothetical protein
MDRSRLDTRAFREGNDDSGGDVFDEQRADDRYGRIRCPRCKWQPRKHDLWQCTCLHLWNTFDTRALCPACGRQWLDTACLRCHQWSPHDAWYA